MKTSKLFELTSHLSKKEIKAFSKYLSRFSGRKGEELSRLFLFILNDPKPEKVKAWAYIFGKSSPFKDEVLRGLMTKLLRELENFLLARLLKENPLLKKKLLLELYNQHDLKKNFKGMLTDVKRELDDIQVRDGNYYRSLANFAHLKDCFAAKHSPKRGENSLDEIQQFLTQSFVIDSLRFSNLALNFTLVTGMPTSTIKIEKGKFQWDLAPYLEVPAAKLWWELYLLFKNNSLKAFLRVFEAVKEHISAVPYDSQYDIFTSLNNFLISNLRRHDLTLLSYLFALYVWGLEAGIALQEENLPGYYFRNYVVCALRLRKYEFALEFIEQYSDKLHLDYREDLRGLCLAQYNFELGNYDEAGTLLASVNSDNIHFGLSARMLRLQLAYQRKEWVLIGSLIQSFKMYLIKSKRLTEYYRTYYKERVGIISKLTGNLSQKKIRLLSEQLKTSEQPLDITPWLLKKLDEKLKS